MTDKPCRLCGMPEPPLPGTFVDRLLTFIVHNASAIFVRSPGTKPFSQLTGAEAIHFIRLLWARGVLPSIVRPNDETSIPGSPEEGMKPPGRAD